MSLKPVIAAFACLSLLIPAAAPAQNQGARTPAAERDCAYDPNFIRLSQMRGATVQESSWKTDESLPVGVRTYTGLMGGTSFAVHAKVCEFLKMQVDTTVIVRNDSGVDPVRVMDQLNAALALPMQGSSLTTGQRKLLNDQGKVQVVDGLSVRDYSRVENGGVTILTEHLWFRG